MGLGWLMRFMVYGLGFRFRALRVEARQAHLGDVCACFKWVSLFLNSLFVPVSRGLASKVWDCRVSIVLLLL